MLRRCYCCASARSFISRANVDYYAYVSFYLLCITLVYTRDLEFTSAMAHRVGDPIKTLEKTVS